MNSEITSVKMVQKVAIYDIFSTGRFNMISTRVLCLMLVIALNISSDLVAQQPPQSPIDSVRRASLYYLPQPPYKDAELASILAFIMPGAGQLYANSRVMGVAELAIATFGALLAASGSKDIRHDSGFSHREIGFSLFAASWLIGLATAADDVRDYNAQVARDVRDGKYGRP